MPKGPQEQFFVELMPDFDQKKEWGKLQDSAREIANVFSEEIARQVQILRAPMAKNLYLEAKPEFDFRHKLEDLAVLRIKEAVHDTFRDDLRRRGGRSVYPIELDPKAVHFSTVEASVRVPYLGLIRHRHNKKILATTEGTAWLMGNITSMRLAEKNNHLWLVIDCRENPTPKKRTKKKPSPRKPSKWLE